MTQTIFSAVDLKLAKVFGNVDHACHMIWTCSNRRLLWNKTLCKLCMKNGSFIMACFERPSLHLWFSYGRFDYFCYFSTWPLVNMIFLFCFHQELRRFLTWWSSWVSRCQRRKWLRNFLVREGNYKVWQDWLKSFCRQCITSVSQGSSSVLHLS